MKTLRRARGAPAPALARRAPIAGVAAAIALCAIASCTRERDLPEGEGVHPAGWDDKTSDAFHARWLQDRRAQHGDELAKIAECRQCHGDDYAGGPVGVSCTENAGCHTKKGGPEFCGTCHGSDLGPMPTTGASAGAHQLHQPFCALCHNVPDKLDSPGHVDGKIDVIFSGIAIANESKAAYDATKRTCSDVYCHNRATIAWKAPAGQAPCNLCHDTPPSESHAAWMRVANTTQACATCHPAPEKPEIAGAHIDGHLDVNTEIACGTCHGTEASQGAPAPALDGSTATTSPGVGAHRRHLDPALPDRIGKVVPCKLCHTVPANWASPGHVLDDNGQLDAASPAEVHLPFGGTFDAATDPKNPTCVVACHFEKKRIWTADDPGTVPACDSCHGFPPLYLRDGTPHTQAPPELSACLKCHPYSPATHVDGTVDLLP